MKRMAILGAFMALAVACSDDDSPTGPSNTGPIVFTVALSAQNEVPPITNSENGGRGTATITFNVARDGSGGVTGGGTANFSAQMNGFPSGSVLRAAHIHPGAAGINGGILVDTGLTSASPIAVNADGTASLNFASVAVSADQAQQIVANPAGFYFNIHTPINPGGAVRGQLTRAQ
ncbi:MAG: CHRD domain-containing protein [Acidobacteria bacterium]|nr:CHRD domain-containing protein [Acidobacteriota bacterium]MCA1650471.1 CHRD domain-containing protein [Acidobacteriota bacterium]